MYVKLMVRIKYRGSADGQIINTTFTKVKWQEKLGKGLAVIFTQTADIIQECGIMTKEMELESLFQGKKQYNKEYGKMEDLRNEKKIRKK